MRGLVQAAGCLEKNSCDRRGRICVGLAIFEGRILASQPGLEYEPKRCGQIRPTCIRRIDTPRDDL